ncbi:MAG: hypothetical protein JWO36_114 [Myxococcales bacterium]|nr:hypothetical protein [Myxococcales bacterium]
MVVAAVCIPALARADGAADRQAQGEQLARDGRYTEAIDAFKAAERLEPRASHSCLIALAYIRRELWPQAEVFLSDCRKRANATDPLPDWVPLAEQQIAERLQNANVAAIDIKVEPEIPGTKITVSSFAPDEVFEPRTIHLAFGHHVLIADPGGPGFERSRLELEITGKTPQHVVIKLNKPGETIATNPVIEPPPAYTTDKTLIKAGLIVGTAGLVAYGVMSIGWYNIRNGFSPGTTSETLYDGGRIAAVSLWAIGAGLLGTGLYLHHKHGKEAPVIAAMLLREGGGVVTVGWQR